MAQAVADDKLRLDDDIRTYLPYKYPNLEYNRHPIRIKHLVTHTSRIPSFSTTMATLLSKWNEGHPVAAKLSELIKQDTPANFFTRLKALKVDAPPGDTYEYSNQATNLMGAILETVYGKPYHELLQTYILSPAKMTSTSTKLTPSQKKRLANGYSGEGVLMPHMTVDSPLWGADGGIKSSIPDMLKYIEFQLAPKNTIATQSRQKQFQRPDDTWIGYYWPIQLTKDGSVAYSHHGGTLSAQNYLYINPAYQLGISIITNVSAPNTGALLNEALTGLIDDLKPL